MYFLADITKKVPIYVHFVEKLQSFDLRALGGSFCRKIRSGEVYTFLWPGCISLKISSQTSWLKKGHWVYSADGNKARRRLLYLSREYVKSYHGSPLRGTANAKNSFCKKLVKWFAQTMCRESHVLDTLHTLHIFDLQRDKFNISFHIITRIWLFRGKVQGGQGQDAGHQVCGGRWWCCR